MTILRREDEEGAGLPAANTNALGPAGLPPPSPHPTRQFADMLLMPIDPARRAALDELLQEIGRETLEAMKGRAPARPILPFQQLSRVHFARFVVMDQPPLDTEPQLAFVVDYDGDEGVPECEHEQAWEQLVKELGALQGFGQILSHCRGYRADRQRAYLKRHRRDTSTSYVAAPGRSVAQIRWEAALRREVELALRGLTGKPAQIRAEVAARLGQRSIPAFPAQPDLTRQIPLELIKAFRLPLTLGAGLSAPLWLLGPVGLLLGATGLTTLGAAAYARFRWLETHDPQYQPVLDAKTHAHLAYAAQDENHFLQNQLTHVVQVKPGPLRALLIRAVFKTLQVLADNQFNHGKLGDIPSIHFARWVMGPDRSVLFFSNFDSSWQSYLGDFIDKASSGLTAVWSNTELYPRTTRLLAAGSRDAGRFLAWTRNYQIPTQVWYSAYPGLSVVNINANTEIRRGLATPEDVDAVTWLARLRNVDRHAVDERYGAEQARETPLNLADIQGLILKGYGHKNEARYLLFRVKTPGPALLTWLAQLPVTSAVEGARERELPDPLLNVAFSYAGLRALGVDPELCDAFSSAFVQGSQHPDRARVNGDVHGDAPERWDWGGPDTPVHVALLVFASDKTSVEKHAAKWRALGEAHGLELVRTLEASTLPGRKEHFGFRDGIAQPIVHGSGDAGIAENTIAAGEIFLGHRDGYGNVSVAPTCRQGYRFGYNGSYMVLRQLEQDVVAFWRSCDAQADSLGLGSEKIASKLVGRWPSGRPLVRYPDRDPTPETDSDDDAFTYFESSADNDRYGARCPFGSHIRRANPRDWGLGENSEESLRLSNLHRIMRRGRPYGRPLVDSMKVDELRARAKRAAEGERDGDSRGLQFICFNANLERQFEFIQQQWCKNPKFAGQVSDADPLLGGRCPMSELGLSDQGLTLQDKLTSGAFQRVADLTPFVTLKGSAYLFMPSLSALQLLPLVVEPSLPAERDQQQRVEALEHIPDDEQLHTERLIDNIRLMLQRRYAGKQTLRDAHPKMHGLVRARLEVCTDLPATLQTPLFQPGKHYEAWVRFSNQHQDPSPDERKDTRGLALKLEQVPGVKLLDGEEQDAHHDFIFLSTPTFVAHDVAGFDELINFVVHKSWVSLLRSGPAMLRHKRSVERHGSPLEVTYFSVVPSLAGGTAVKYRVKPQDPTQTPLGKDRERRDFLRERLVKQLKQGEYCFDVEVQPFADQQSTPIEDPTVLWDTPYQRVAVLRIYQQHDFDTDLRREQGENMVFNPFRCLPEHRPLGGISRARRQVYRAIATFRHNRNGV